MKAPRPSAVLVAALVALAVAVVAVVVVGTSRTGAGGDDGAVIDSTPGLAAATAPTHRSPNARGRITAMTADTWTITPSAGAPVVVDLEPSTRFGTARKPVERSTFIVGSSVGVIGARQDGRITADRVVPVAARSRPPSTLTTAPSPSSAHPTPSPSEPPTSTTPSTCAIQADLAAAVEYASGQGEQSAAAVLDTDTGSYAAAGAADAPFNTASVVKVLLATDLLLTGQMTGSTAATAATMVTRSDDDAADALYDLAGGDQVVTTVGRHYGIAGLGTPPADPGQWGETKITANGLAHLYAALKKDPVVWPWLSTAMRGATRAGADGTDQYFGIPAATGSWAVKQGWMTGLGPGSTYDSTGYVQGDRYVVVLLTYGAAARYGTAMAATISQMARDVLPGGAPGNPGPASSACPAT